MKRLVLLLGLIMLTFDVVALDSKPMPFEYFEENVYANMFGDTSLFVEIPAVTGAVIGDITGIAAGIPIGFVVGFPVALVTETDEAMMNGIYYGWLCIGLPVRIVLAQVVSAPFYLMKKVFWDIPQYCFSS